MTRSEDEAPVRDGAEPHGLLSRRHLLGLTIPDAHRLSD